jgi:hypothetical protein
VPRIPIEPQRSSAVALALPTPENDQDPAEP